MIETDLNYYFKILNRKKIFIGIQFDIFLLFFWKVFSENSWYLVHLKNKPKSNTSNWPERPGLIMKWKSVEKNRCKCLCFVFSWAFPNFDVISFYLRLSAFEQLLKQQTLSLLMLKLDAVASQLAVTLKNKRRKWHEKSNVVNKFFIIYYFVDLLLLFAMPTQSFQTWDWFDKKTANKNLCTSFVLFIRSFYIFFCKISLFCSFFSLFGICFFLLLLPLLSLNNHNNRQYPRYVHNFRSI